MTSYLTLRKIFRDFFPNLSCITILDLSLSLIIGFLLEQSKEVFLVFIQALACPKQVSNLPMVLTFLYFCRCEEHGQCKNGTCICMTGWNGRHCTLAGCPADCSGNGACVMENDEWVCRCESTWEGLDCSVKLETICDDKKDNDKGQ